MRCHGVLLGTDGPGPADYDPKNTTVSGAILSVVQLVEGETS